MTLPEKWRVLARAWSVRIAAIGATLYALLLAADPLSLQAAWQAMPPEIRLLLPEHIRTWITLALFVAVIVARGATQPKVARQLGLLSTAAATPAWLTAARAPITRAIGSIAVHCSATREGQVFRAADIRRWHLAKKWADIGYHFVVNLDGTIEPGRPLQTAGAHVAGHNAYTIGICYVGGVAADGKTPKDTRTPEQKAALVALLTELRRRWPAAPIKGHRDYSPDRNGNGRIEPSEWMKACPSFDVREYADLGR